MCGGQACIAVMSEQGQAVVRGEAPAIERFSTLLLDTADPQLLGYDGEWIEIRASNRTITYQVIEPTPDGGKPSDDVFVTGRLVRDDAQQEH